MAACAAIELLHNFSLIHDDIEDGDQLRHGRPTVWAQYGLEHGINAGDAVGALAQLALAPAARTHGPEIAFTMSMELARANLRTCEGQAMDLALAARSSATIDDYVEMIDGKTASLFGCAAALGAACASADEAEIELCRALGRVFGLGFQIRDDVDGIWAATAQTGKVSAHDLTRRKKTFPVVWALERAPARSVTVIQAAFAQADLDAAGVERVREVLETSGAYDAARAAADTYFEAAADKALGMAPLSDFVIQNRT
jgi:geranylgeranyl diphosphate synthase type I